jgi:hypothetical protein
VKCLKVAEPQRHAKDLNVLTKLNQLLQQFSNRKSFLLLLTAYALYMPVFFFADVPFGLSRIKPYAQGTGILDVELFYTAEQAYRRLALFGEQGRAVYLNILMGDLIYPALLGGLLSVSITLLVRRLDLSGAYWQYLGWLPLANMALDYTEDALLVSLLYHYPVQLPMAAALAGMVTFAKNIAGMLGFLALGFGLLALLFRRHGQSRPR